MIKDDNGMFALDELREQIKRCTTKEQRIGVAVQLFKQPPKIEEQQKNAEESKKFRNEGNQLYSRSKNFEQFLQALEKYSRSIAFAPVDSTELSIAYANRSAILFRIEKYEECVQTIDKSLNFGYPDAMRAKVLFRKIECLKALKSAESKKVYHETRRWIDQIENEEERQKMRDKLELSYKKEFNHSLVTETDLKDLAPNFHYKKLNDEAPVASAAVEIRHSRKFGRHLVATRDIRPGEILAREEPFCMVLSSPKRYSYCWMCLEPLWNCVPCEQCIYVLYCSDECKQQAWEQFHQVECCVLPHLLGLYNPEKTNKQIAMLRLIILAWNEVKDFDKLTELVNEIDGCEDSRMRGFLDGKFLSKKFRTILSLNGFKHKKEDVPFSVQEHCLSVVCTILYQLGTRSNFFGDQIEDWQNLMKKKKVLLVGSLLWRMLDTINMYGFCAREHSNQTDKGMGIAILAFLSLLNHSCYPNVAKSIRRKYEFVFAILPIKKGEQLFINYVANCGKTSKLARQQDLYKRYFFTCECIACRENWPPTEKFPKLQEVAAMTGLISTPKWEELRNELQAAVSSINKPVTEYLSCITDVPKLLDRLSHILEVLTAGVPPPCKEIELISQKIRMVYEKTRYS